MADLFPQDYYLKFQCRSEVPSGVARLSLYILLRSDTWRQIGVLLWLNYLHAKTGWGGELREGQGDVFRVVCHRFLPHAHAGNLKPHLHTSNPRKIRGYRNQSWLMISAGTPWGSGLREFAGTPQG